MPQLQQGGRPATRTKEAGMTDYTKPMAERLDAQITEWQNKLEEARVQANLAGREARDAIRANIETMERELARTRAEWKRLEDASEGAMGDIERGFNESVEAMRKAFASATQHFTRQDERNED
jgi:hypothetical protein